MKWNLKHEKWKNEEHEKGTMKHKHENGLKTNNGHETWKWEMKKKMKMKMKSEMKNDNEHEKMTIGK